MPHQWLEVNLNAASPQQLQALPLAIVDPLIHQVLAGSWRAWFYSLYLDSQTCQLRLRVLWQESATADHEKVATFLNVAQGDGLIVDWYPGSQGERGKTYPGEADDYGPEMWPVTYQNWMSGCEMALVILKHRTEGTLSKPLEYHWSRRLHMFTNPLGLTLQQEVQLCVMQARGYGWRPTDG